MRAGLAVPHPEARQPRDTGATAAIELVQLAGRYLSNSRQQITR